MENLSDEGRLERFKARLALRQVIVEKLIIAVLVVIAGCWANEALEKTKLNVQKDLQDHDGEIKKALAGAERDFDSIRQKQGEGFAQQLASESRRQDRLLRDLDFKNNFFLQNVKANLEFDVSFAKNKLNAYDGVWLATNYLHHHIDSVIDAVDEDGLPEGANGRNYYAVFSMLLDDLADYYKSVDGFRMYLDDSVNACILENSGIRFRALKKNSYLKDVSESEIDSFRDDIGKYESKIRAIIRREAYRSSLPVHLKKF